MVVNSDAPAATAAAATTMMDPAWVETSSLSSEERKEKREAQAISPASELLEEFTDTSSNSEESDSIQRQQGDDSTSTTTNTTKDSDQEKKHADFFKAADHVYVWCHAGAYQHHGIVLQVDHTDNKVLIADFTNMGGDDDKSSKKKRTGHLSSFQSSSSDSSGSEAASQSFSGLPGGFRMVQEDMISNNDDDDDDQSKSSSTKKPQKWCKVKYNANPFEVAFWRPGTCSGATPDPPDQILARVHFLMMHFHLVPPYHLLECNCETVAVWCTTGEWRTRQVSHLLNWTKTTSVLGTGGAYYSAATATTTTCATTGVAGWVGATTEISLLAANPLLLPVICITGVAVGGMALWNSLQTRHRWKVTSTLLNTEFERFWTEPAVSGVTLVQIDTQDDETVTVATMTSSVDDETSAGETTALNCVSA